MPVLFAADGPPSAAAVFTQNRFCAAPVIVARTTVKLPVALTGKVYVAGPDEGAEALWKAFDGKLRSQIRRPMKEGVTVRFGRIGTQGQTSVKTLGDEAAAHFSNGWAWLLLDRDALRVASLHDADTPLVHDGMVPLLTLDVWEHAYYIDYRNDRPRFAGAVLANVVNWEFVAQNLDGKGAGRAEKLRRLTNDPLVADACRRVRERFDVDASLGRTVELIESLAGVRLLSTHSSRFPIRLRRTDALSEPSRRGPCRSGCAQALNRSASTTNEKAGAGCRRLG